MRAILNFMILLIGLSVGLPSLVYGNDELAMKETLEIQFHVHIPIAESSSGQNIINEILNFALSQGPLDLLDALIDRSQVYHLGVFDPLTLEIQLALQSHLKPTENSLTELQRHIIQKLQTDLEESPFKVEVVNDHISFEGPFQTAARIRFLSNLEIKSQKFKDVLNEYLRSEDFAIVEAAADGLAKTKHLDIDSIYNILNVVKSQPAARVFLYLAQETVYSLLVNSPENQKKIFDFFFKYSTEIFKKDRSSAFFVAAAFGVAQTHDADILGFLFLNSIPNKRNTNSFLESGSLFAMGTQSLEKQTVNTQFALVDNLFNSHLWIKDAARSALEFHHQSDKEFIDLLNKKDPAVNSALKEIIWKKYGFESTLR